MKEPLDDKILTLIDPFSSKELHFEINKEGNASLIFRLIRKRKSIQNDLRSLMQEIKDIRTKNNLDKIDEKIEVLGEDLSKLNSEDFESEEEYKKEHEKISKKILDLRDKYPQRLFDALQEAQDIFYHIDRIGIKIFLLVLNPLSKLPDSYESWNEFFEEGISDEKVIEEAIVFFSESLNSTSKFPSGLETSVKIQSRKEALQEK